MRLQCLLVLVLTMGLLTACTVNQPPLISTLPDQILVQNALTPVSLELDFEISDAEDAPEDLRLSFNSSDPAVASTEDMVHQCSGEQCRLTILVKREHASTATIQVTVRDSANAAATSRFELQIAPRLLKDVNEALLRSAIATADPGDVLELEPGSVLDLADELRLDKHLTILGNGGRLTGKNTRLLRILPAVQVRLESATLQQGRAQDDGETLFDEPLGGAIFNQGLLELWDMTFFANQAVNGGAIYNEGELASLLIEKSVFGAAGQANRAERSGAAVFNDGGTVVIRESQFMNNNALKRAAAIYNLGERATLTVETSLFHDNVAEDGGAIKNELGTVTIRNSEFLRNIASVVEGGAIVNTSGTLRLYTSLLRGNRALQGAGGALYSSGDLLLDATIFEDNHTVAYGGAVAQEIAAVDFVIRNGSRLSGNSADGDGGAIYNGSRLNLSADSLIIGNRADANSSGAGAGGGIYNEQGLLMGISSSNVRDNQPDDVFNLP